MITQESLEKKYKAKLERILGKDIKFSDLIIKENWICIYGNEKKVLFYIKEMINCCGILVLTELKLPYNYTGRVIHDLVVDIAKALEYSMVICTDVTSDHRKALEAAKWTESVNVINKRTRNNIYMYYKKLYRR